MFFTTRDPQSNYSTLGKGFRGGACDAEVYNHALLMEYQNDDITFARVIVVYMCINPLFMQLKMPIPG